MQENSIKPRTGGKRMTSNFGSNRKITAADRLDAMRERHSVRAYTDKPNEGETLAILEKTKIGSFKKLRS